MTTFLALFMISWNRLRGVAVSPWDIQKPHPRGFIFLRGKPEELRHHDEGVPSLFEVVHGDNSWSDWMCTDIRRLFTSGTGAVDARGGWGAKPDRRTSNDYFSSSA
jgi:hypothetical protein